MQIRQDYDVIVVGCGGYGSATLYWLAKRIGRRALGLEQFALFHHNGSSQDHSRIIRYHYHDPAYTRLVPHAFAAWAEVEEESAVQLVHKTGGVWMVHPDAHGQLDAEAHTLDAVGMPYARGDGAEVMRRWPQFHITEEVEALFQDDVGLVDAAKANAAHIALARLHGATVVEHCRVEAIRSHNDHVEVRTAGRTYTCRHAVVTAAAWTNQVLQGAGLHLPLAVTQEQVTYYATPHIRQFAIGRFPIFAWHAQGRDFYGFPVYGEVATKAAIHASGPEVTPETRTFEPDRHREQELYTFLSERIPHFIGPTLYTKTCLYAFAPDDDFVVGPLPPYGNVLVAYTGGSGFKFASVMGKVLSQLALDGRTEYSIDHFAPTRFQHHP